jgi:hypothetical protein
MSTGPIKTESSAAVQWSRNVPLATNVFIMKDTVLAVGLSSLIFLALLIVLSGGEDWESMVMLWAAVTGFMLVVFLIAMVVVLWNRIGMEFRLDAGGVSVATGRRESRINSAVTILGTLARSPGTAGAGLLAKSSETVSYEWPEIKKVIVYPRQKVIYLKAGLLYPLRLYCTAENYADVERMVREKAANASFGEKRSALF